MQKTHNVSKKNWAAKLMAIVVVVSMVASTLVLFAPEASARTGSDSFGYTYKDSAATGGPVFADEWIELVGHSDATLLISSSTDAGQSATDIGFTFEFYEKEYTTWGNGGDNGYINLGSAGYSNYWTSYRMPYAGLGKAIMGGWFDGGFCRASNSDAGVYYATVGDAPNRKLVVQYEDQGAWYPSVYQCPGAAAANALTWQIILHEGSNQITINWEDAQGGYSSDNEQLTSGIQDYPQGIEYVYRRSPAAIADETSVVFSPPPPARNDLRLKSTIVPDPISLADDNFLAATVGNYGVNCDTAGSCTPVPEETIDVTAKIFSIKQSESTYDFDDNDGGFTEASIQGTASWTNNLNDGKGNHNYGDEGTDDGAWSSGRKSSTLGGMFNDNQKIHYDGTNILIANKGDDNIKSLDPSTDQVTVIIATSYTYLNDVIDVTEDSTHYYTLAKTSGTYSYITKVCKWLKSDTTATPSCNSTSARYGTALTEYGGQLFVLQTMSSSAYRKVIIIDTDDMGAAGSFAYSSGVPSYYYAQDIDVDDATGDLYIAYRDYYGRIRQYDRSDSGTYSASSYSQKYTYGRYHSHLTVQDGYVYNTGYYYSSYYGGMKKTTTGSTLSTSTLWTAYSGANGYKGSVAVTSAGDIYVASNYAYYYYSFSNWDDKIWVHEKSSSGSYSGSPTRTLGPNPPSLSALETPSYDTSDAIGMTMSFKISYQMYYRYEGAYMESSIDGGSTWNYIDGDHFTTGKYYGTVFNTYNNPVSTTIDTWTYYNTNDLYTYNTHTAPWKEMKLNLDSFTGNSDVKFRWVVGFNQYDNTYYYDSYFRLDDVVVTVKEADETFAEETQTIASLGFKETANVDFFQTNKFNPAAEGLKVGSELAIMINVADNGGDQDMSNNRDVQFRDVKFVIFADDFEDGNADGWETGKVKYGSGDTWDVRSRDSNAGSYSMDSDFRRSSALPADNYVSTGPLDLTLPVEAEMQMFISYYAYYTYDGYQVQASPDGGETWNMLEPKAADELQYWTIYNYAYYANPLRGLKGYAFYGSSTGFTYAPDPQGWVKATYDMTEYCGNSDVRIRVVTGWSTLSTGPTYFESFFRFDDIAVTGLVYNNNVGLTGFELPDPLGIDSTVPVEATVINAGIVDQTAGAAKVRLQLGPMGLETYASSDDLESYANEAAATVAGWSTSDDCNTTYSTCGNWGYNAGDPGFVFRTDDGDGDETKSWGPDGGEFQMYYGGGSVSAQTGALDFTGASSDLTLTMKHRYNFDYYAGYTSYNGGQAQISTDGGDTWTVIAPSGGYSGTMYNYAGYGNPLYGQAGFVHCGSCPGAGGASDDADEYISSEFDMAAYVDMTDVRLKFVVGMYSYQWPGDGEHWYIDSLSFTGTGMESVVFEESWDISGDGVGGAFESGSSKVVGVDYRFQVPGAYKVVFDTWIGSTPDSGIDEFEGDNSVSLARETMFTVVGTTADESALSKKNDELNDRWYDSGWHSSVDGGPKDGYQWQPSATTGASSSPTWWAGEGAYGVPYDGDDSSLVSPVFDLSTSTSAKLVFDHKFDFYGSESASYSYYYEGGRVEISTDAGTTWSSLAVTSGQGYGGSIYNYAYYGHPFYNQQAFVMGSGGWVESQCRLDSYTGDGMDQVQIRFRFGGGFPNWISDWEIDNVGVYGLGFDLAMTSESSPYTLEVGETFTMSTSFKNQGMGDLGPSGPVSSAYAYAYVNDMSGNEKWSSSSSLGTLAMAYYDDALATHAGEETAAIDFNFPGMSAAGLYTAGVKVADSDGNLLADLFKGNNDASHMLIVGKSADMGSPLLTGGENWVATENEPADVGDGAMSVSWDRTDVATETLAVTIGGQSTGFSPATPEVQIGTAVTWTNSDTITHTVTDKNAQFDSFDISPGESWSLTFTEVGLFGYYCKYHPMMEGSISVTSSQSADEQVRTNYIEVWSSTAYLVFWANFEMSEDSEISIYAQKKGASLDDADSIGLWDANGFSIMDGSDHEEVGNSLSGKSDGWNPYYMSLDSMKLGYSSLSYDPADDNAYSFVFRARGVEGAAHIGGVEVIRTLDTGFFLTKSDVGQLTYDIFPSLAVEIDYFARNIGTVDNTFRMTPELDAQGKSYDGAAFDISINVLMNGNTFEDITATQNEDGTWTYDFDMSPDDEALITVRFGAPDYDQEAGEPAGNRKFDVIVNGYDTGSDDSLREPVAATLFIKPSQFVLGEMTFDRAGVIEGETLDITVKAWNEGNYASDVLVVFYVMDSTGDAYSTPDGIQRMNRVASTTVPLMAPKPVMENDGIYQTWYYATATWDEAYIPGTTVQEFETVNMYAMINPDAEEQDVKTGVKTQDEYLNQKDDNDAEGTIAVVKNKSSTPSFAVGIIGLSVAALVASIGASLRREEE